MASKTIKPLKIAIYSIIFLLCLNMAYAFEIDADDEYIALSGDTIIASFIVSEYEPNMIMSTNFDWISFSKNSDIKEKDVFGTLITRDIVSVPYYINIPEDTDIGVYRTTIEIKSDTDVKYLNVKISVQNYIFKNILTIFNKKIAIISLISILFLTILMIFIYLLTKFRERLL